MLNWTANIGTTILQQKWSPISFSMLSWFLSRVFPQPYMKILLSSYIVYFLMYRGCCLIQILLLLTLKSSRTLLDANIFPIPFASTILLLKSKPFFLIVYFLIFFHFTFSSRLLLILLNHFLF